MLQKKKCENCKKLFIPRKKGGKPHRFCNIKCRLMIWNKINKEKLQIYRSEWQKNNPACLAKQKKWRKNNPEKIKKSQKKYYYKNKDKRKKNSEKWRKEHPERVTFLRKRWKEKNNKKINSDWMKRHHFRWKNDKSYKIGRVLRNRIRKCLNGTSKSNNTLKLLGVDTIEKVRNHLEKQFEKGMTWNNYNFKTWHIDHITPIYSFDLTKKEEQYKAFNYLNLQPMWAVENLSKGKKII